jgi:hypothetical protein
MQTTFVNVNTHSQVVASIFDKDYQKSAILPLNETDPSSPLDC